MTTETFITLAENPQRVEALHEPQLLKMTERYPYFSQAYLLWLKAAQVNYDGDINDEELETVALHVNDLRWLFFFMYPEMELAPEQVEFKRSERFSGSYFDILNAASNEGDDAGESLRKIAQRLKESRAMMQKDEVVDVQQAKIDHLEEQVRLLIHESKYEEAIEILKQLNLINPKKSIYFADQIRFLEKIIENLK
jgi:hypothetical protein